MAKWQSRAGIKVDANQVAGQRELMSVTYGNVFDTMEATMFNALFEPCLVTFEEALTHLRHGGKARCADCEGRSVIMMRHDGYIVDADTQQEECTAVSYLFMDRWILE
jgi:hypothetical protein